MNTKTIAVRRSLLLLTALILFSTVHAQQRRHFRRTTPWQTDTLMAHDPVMAQLSDGSYLLLSTGIGVSWATSKDRRTWTVQPRPFMPYIPAWTRDSVPGFDRHVWAPDVLLHNGRWWLAYSCSTFGKNTSAIGLMSIREDSLAMYVSQRDSLAWRDEGCLVASQGKRNDWNAIDPCFFTDDDNQVWLTWGSFWDGIQLAPLGKDMHLKGKPRTIARRYDPDAPNKAENPTSKYAGTNAIEAPFVMRHDGWYYLFCSWDYCCRGEKSNYRVVVGRSQRPDGPYLDRQGRDMLKGGGEPVISGDGQLFEAAGHSAAYTFRRADGESYDLFICHGYSKPMRGAAILVQHEITWTADGWPQLK